MWSSKGEKLAQKITNLSSNISGESLNKNLNVWMKKYEDFVGLTEVKVAQNRVLEAETKFVKSQEQRRETQQQIGSIQRKLQELHGEIDRIPRGDDKYLALITQEHAVIKDEKRLRENFQLWEKEERDNFAVLSHAVRDSHEKERAQAEKTKYWSIIGSILGTVLGVVGTTINNRLRMKELRELILETATNNQTNTADLEDAIIKLSSAVRQSNNHPHTQLVQEQTGEKWKEVNDNIAKVTEEFRANHNVYLQQAKKFEALLVTSSFKGQTSGERQVVVPEDEFKSLLSSQQQEITRIVLISSVVIPFTVYALLKFVNL